jgi:hypothetical protein
MLGMWRVGAPPVWLSSGPGQSRFGGVGKRPRRSGVKSQSRAPNGVESRQSSNQFTGYKGNAWVLLRIKNLGLPSIFDSGSSISFVSGDVFDGIKKLGLPHTVDHTEERCHASNGEPCDAKHAVAFDR